MTCKNVFLKYSQMSIIKSDQFRLITNNLYTCSHVYIGLVVMNSLCYIHSDEPPYESIITRLHKAWPGWQQVTERFRYTIAGIVFLLGVISLILTLLPGASASKKGSTDIWTKLENQLAPFLSMRHHRPPPT